MWTKRVEMLEVILNWLLSNPGQLRASFVGENIDAMALGLILLANLYQTVWLCSLEILEQARVTSSPWLTSTVSWPEPEMKIQPETENRLIVIGCHIKQQYFRVHWKPINQLKIKVDFKSQHSIARMYSLRLQSRGVSEFSLFIMSTTAAQPGHFYPWQSL